MKRCLSILALAVAAAALAPASASAERALDSYCSPSGDFCIAIAGSKRQPEFVLRSFAFAGQYKLCLKSPSHDRECGWWRLKKGRHGVYASRVSIADSFFLTEPGHYRVSAFYAEQQLGRGLDFDHGKAAA
ncbi:MAG: hypothetical protein JST31_06790 [Actinobacteria bacterium]|nr:hypothetical protein [Actinomycetota bacterium]